MKAEIFRQKSVILFMGITLFFNHSIFAQNQHKSDSVIQVLNSGRKIPDSIRAELYYDISRDATDPQVKMLYAEKLVELANRLSSYQFLIKGYTDLGYSHKLMGELDEALQAYLKAANLAAQNEDPIVEADTYTNIAAVYTSNEDHNRSLAYYQKALKLYENRASDNRLSGIYINYGYAAYMAQLYDSAISLSNKAIAYAKSANNEKLAYYGQANLSFSLAKTGRIKQAEKEFEMALANMEKRQDNYGLSDCLIEMGGALLENDQIEKAISYLDRGYKIAQQNGLKQQIQNGAKFLAQAYKQKGDIELAFDYQSKYYTYRDSLINAEQIRKLADLRTEYEVGQKQAEVDLLTAEKRTQQVILFSTAGGALFVVVLLGLVYKNYRDKNRINKVLEDQKAQLEALNSTKDKFFSIISHDLRGPVSAFSGITRLIKHAVQNKEHDDLIEISDHIDESVEHLSGLLDNLLSWAMQQQGHFPNVPEKLNLKILSSEIKGIFSNMADAKQIDLKVDVPDGIDLWADKNTSMTILRNLVNNALKFTKSGGEVKLAAEQQEEMAVITVSDTGVGMSEDKLKTLFQLQGTKSDFGTAGEKGLGLGLQLVYEFVEMNNGTIEVESEEGKGTQFIVQLPLFESVSQEVAS